MSKIRGIFSVKGQRSKVKGQKSESGIQSRETAKKDSDEEAARRDSAEDLTGGGSAALTDRPDNQSGGKEESGARLNLAERKKKQRTEWHWG